MSKPKLPKKIIVDPDATNESGLPIKTVLAHLQKDGVFIEFEGAGVGVMRKNFEHTQELVAKIPQDRRPQMLADVEKSIRAIMPRIKDRTACKEEHDGFCTDLMLWEALKRSAN